MDPCELPSASEELTFVLCIEDNAIRAQALLLCESIRAFSRSVAAGLKPWTGVDQNVHASTGFVGREASEYWGSNQAALALAIWQSTRRVFHYPQNYNVPLHLLLNASTPISPLIHVHYHWLFTRPYCESALAALRTLGVETRHLDWLAARLPIAPTRHATTEAIPIFQ